MRKRRAVKRDVLPDPIYKSKIVAKLINTIMLDGKKGIAQSIVYEAFDTVKNKTGKDALETFNEAMENDNFRDFVSKLEGLDKLPDEALNALINTINEIK